MNDPQRPLFHFTPRSGWMNDPKPFFWRGEHHIFFQYSPGDGREGLKHWGHALSSDGVRWQELPVAFSPDSEFDENGCWTGCVVEHEGTFYAFYTGIPHGEWRQMQCLAVSQDLLTWTKHLANPVIAEPPPGNGSCWRDPQVWREGAGWKMVIGGEKPDGSGGLAHLYTSPDLLRWEYAGVLCEGDAAQTGSVFECPDFFPVGDKHVLLSSCGRTFWQTGSYDGRTFTPEAFGPCDGEAFYAAKTSFDGPKRLLWGWIREACTPQEYTARGWSSALSLPRHFNQMRGRLGQNCAAFWNLNDFAHSEDEQRQIVIKNGTHIAPTVRGDCLKILLSFKVQNASQFGFVLRADDNGQGTEIIFDRANRTLSCNGQSVKWNIPNRVGIATVVLDRSVIEVFAESTLTARLYSQNPQADHVALFARGGALDVRSFHVHSLAPPS